MLDVGGLRHEHGGVWRRNKRLDSGKGWCGERLKDLLDGDETGERVLTAMRATHHRRYGRLDTTVRMMCVFRHRAHLMGLVGLTDNPTHSGRDRRSDKDRREDPRREASNHQIHEYIEITRGQRHLDLTSLETST